MSIPRSSSIMDIPGKAGLSCAAGSFTHTCRLQGGFGFVYIPRVRSKRIKTQELPETQGRVGLWRIQAKLKTFIPEKCTYTQGHKTFVYNLGRGQGPIMKMSLSVLTVTENSAVITAI